MCREKPDSKKKESIADRLLQTLREYDDFLRFNKLSKCKESPFSEFLKNYEKEFAKSQQNKDYEDLSNKRVKQLQLWMVLAQTNRFNLSNLLRKKFRTSPDKQAFIRKIFNEVNSCEL